MNNIVISDDKNITVDKDKVFNIINDLNIVIVVDKDVSLTFNIDEKVNTNIYIYNVDHSINIFLNMNKKKALCNLYYSNINYDDNKYKITVVHNKPMTEVNLYNHGVNVGENKLVYNVSSKIGKTINGCITNQDNRIINIGDGKSTIYPILLIDNYDVSSSHSAYIGKFSDDILFYMESRGIDLKKAYELLLKGFLIYHSNEKIEKFMYELSKI